ncbi:MAG: 16S rRNA (cytidine(1402)-2'-O)-methyltransferase [Eubacteriales bacterium]|nr:16S rRNA (cytidine(1402)-2'-O)-methyltransferase [Eubacteriales bacterium]
MTNICAHEDFGGNISRCGTLYLVPTPLGNPDDLSPRARSILESVDYIAAEDTRRAARLLSSVGIGNDLISYYEQNADQRDEQILNDLVENAKSVAVISDAGTPCVSDPGASLVRKAIERNIKVVSLPGPSAILTALAASALDPSRFVFLGFAPPKGRKRDEFFEKLAQEEYTVVFFESPHRLAKTLAAMEQEGLAERRLTIARELTKEYEEYLYLDVMSASRYYETVEPRGEFTLVLEGVNAFERRTDTIVEEFSDEELRNLLRQLLTERVRTKQAAKILSKITGVEQRRLYDLALEVENDL